jgi:hypothetical protein
MKKVAEAELLELLEIATGNSFMGFTMYMTVMFAYVVTAYFVGEKLTFTQVFLVSGLFIFGACASTGATVISLARAAGYIAAAKAIPESTYQAPFWWAYEDSNFWVYFLLTTCSVGVILGLFFMWNVRHPKTE